MSRDQPGVVQLPAAGVPADQGLSSLGLIMQLGGSVAAVGMAVLAFAMLFATARTGTSDALWLFLLLATCIVRSWFHRAAGLELVYGRTDGATPLIGLVRYVVIGLAHSLLFAIALRLRFGTPTPVAVGFGLGLAVWPAILGGLYATGLFARFAAKVPVAEDKGFEGAAILMTVLGACGVLLATALLLGMFEGGGRALREGRVLLAMLGGLMLLARSVLHVRAGLAGLRSTSIDRAVDHANRYAGLGIVSALCVGGALLIGVMAARLDVLSLVVIAGVTWLLMVWPLTVRRFFGDRQFADLLAGDHAAIHRRAPDAGLTCLGWLLVAHAAFALGFLIPEQLTAGDPDGFGRVLTALDPEAHSPWWRVGVVMFELWAGYELIRMTDLHRVIATAYAVVATAVTLYLYAPILRNLEHLSLARPAELLAVMPLGLALVVPISALLLVNRRLAPTAQARFKT